MLQGSCVSGVLLPHNKLSANPDTLYLYLSVITKISILNLDIISVLVSYLNWHYSCNTFCLNRNIALTI
jgi:hypothetical protein